MSDKLFRMFHGRDKTPEDEVRMAANQEQWAKLDAIDAARMAAAVAMATPLLMDAAGEPFESDGWWWWRDPHESAPDGTLLSGWCVAISDGNITVQYAEGETLPTEVLALIGFGVTTGMGVYFPGGHSVSRHEGT